MKQDISTRVLATITGGAIIALARFITGVRPEWRGTPPEAKQRIYVANHCSHADTVLIWSVLPPALRRMTRPVAGRDYWGTGGFKSFIGSEVFNVVLIDRERETRTEDPVEAMLRALDDGSSLILFPEGTRNMTDAPLLPLKAGIHLLAGARPAIEIVPVWIENLNRVLPKGGSIPVPILCTVTFGTPLTIAAGEQREPFLERLRLALLETRPQRAVAAEVAA
jgi:1-acyl-sn-glycerol-3-phosphate acyltransferase